MFFFANFDKQARLRTKRALEVRRKEEEKKKQIRPSIVERKEEDCRQQKVFEIAGFTSVFFFVLWVWTMQVENFRALTSI